MTAVVVEARDPKITSEIVGIYRASGKFGRPDLIYGKNFEAQHHCK